jgi:hypothetical protein
LIGGANDINKNETNIGLKHLGKFVENRRNTNIVVVTAPTDMTCRINHV